MNCPVCRAESTAPARRCFVEAECPVCLTTTSSTYVLTCGHVVCANDLKTLGLPAEVPVCGERRRRSRRIIKAVVTVFSKCMPLLILAFASRDPGAPMQFLYTSVGMLTGRFDSICAEPCYSVRETGRHICHDDCDCDGGRTCSFFSFCVGESGECEASQPPQKSWELRASEPRGAAGMPAGPERHRANVSSTGTSRPFTLLGLPDLALQLRVLPGSGGGAEALAVVRVRGPAGYFARVEVSHAGRTYTQARVEPLAGDEAWAPSALERAGPSADAGAPATARLAGVRFDAPPELAACAPTASGRGRAVGPPAVGAAAAGGCDDVSLDVSLAELLYVPTFTMRGEVEPEAAWASRARATLGPGFLAAAPGGLWSHAMRRGSSVTAPFEIAGTGRFGLHVFPQGSEDAPFGRSSVLLTGPRGVELAYVLRVRGRMLGSLASPLRCADAGEGCWVRDAGRAGDGAGAEPGVVAVSVLVAQHQLTPAITPLAPKSALDAEGRGSWWREGWWRR